jgi:GntR family transcriptional regulator
MVRDNRQVPAYRQIQIAVESCIESGKLKPGDRVWSERELASKFRVSLMTARHALKELEREGRVERRRGAGTFVALPKIHFNKLVSFSEQVAAKGLVSHSRLLEASRGHVDEEIAACIGLPADAELLKLVRLRQADGRPFAIETCYASAEQFPALLEQPLDRWSLFHTFEHQFGIPLGYADEEVDATAADARTASLLELPRGAPLLRIRQILYSKSGAPIAYTHALYRSDRHSLSIRRFR